MKKFNYNNLKLLFQSELIKNSFWGIVGTFLQTLFGSLFFIIIARKFTTVDFAHFLIATTIYQIIVAFSSMGLGQWYIREFAAISNKIDLTNKFLKIQMWLGFIFYFVAGITSFTLYKDKQIITLSLLLGTNIIFDNIIYAIRCMNIAELNQKKTFNILVIDGFLKLLVGCALFVYPFSIVSICIFLIFVRFFSLNLFIRMGSSDSISIKQLWISKISYEDIKNFVFVNWKFIIIGGVSIVYWRLSNIIISKFLTLEAVANYEISFKIFSLFQALPFIASSSIYPMFNKLINSNDIEGVRSLYKKIYLFFYLFSIFSYAFIYAFAPLIVKNAFGSNYIASVNCTQEMFLTILILPTVLLQVQLITAMRLEKMDMWFNIVSLIINVGGCFIGLNFYKSLSVINFSIFGSFLIFHICQDILLVKMKITSYKSCIIFYISLFTVIVTYRLFENKFNGYLFFIGFSSLLILISVYIILNQQKKPTLKDINTIPIINE
ncbi:MAG: lipopolysaccharide biosynthesis protein [Janthinobacterium lividum]